MLPDERMSRKISDKHTTPAIDLADLTEAEREHIVKVIAKDFEIRVADRKRLSKVEEVINNNVLGSSTKIESNNCSQCGREFGLLTWSRIICKTCNRIVCERCSTQAPGDDGQMMCILCIRKNGFKAMTCEWFYQRFFQKYEDFGSSIIVKNVLGDKYEEVKAISDYYLEPNRRSITLETDHRSFDERTLNSVRSIQTRKFHSDHKAVLIKLTTEHSRIRSLKGIPRNEKSLEYEKMLKVYKEETVNLLESYMNVIYLSTEKHFIATNQNLDNIAKDVLNYVREQVEKIIREPIDKETLESLIRTNDCEDEDKETIFFDEAAITPENYLAQMLVEKVRVKLRI